MRPGIVYQELRGKPGEAIACWRYSASDADGVPHGRASGAYASRGGEAQEAAKAVGIHIIQVVRNTEPVEP